MNSKSKILISLISVALFFLGGFFLPKKIGSEKSVIFSVDRGWGSKEIAQSLEKENLIWWGPLFRGYVLITGKSKKLQAGVYELNASMNMLTIAGKIALGDTLKKTITIPEGFNLKQIEDELSLELLGHNLLGLFTADFKSEFGFLNDAPAGESLEGFFFPDTYKLDVSMTDNEIAETFLKNFDKKMTADLKEEIKKQNKTIFEIITMASLIEKEANKIEDKEIISGILWKRLKAGMPLQVDATILYITGKNGTGVSIEDTKIDSPYNTYKYRGLPKGPICSPGLESVEAAINPKTSNYWYYLSTPEGKTIFSRTLEEHNYAKAKYLK